MVDVVSFSCKDSYEIDGIKVYNVQDFLANKQLTAYDIIVCHAPHYKTEISFLKKYCSTYKNIVFFFHGNEVFDTIKVNPYTFNYTKRLVVIKKISRKIRDKIKLCLMRNALKKFDASYVFVSKWMKKTALEHLRLSEKQLHDSCYVINNSIGKRFEQSSYDRDAKKKYDFITIRGHIDGVKYCVDIVEKFANIFTQYNFLVIGQGTYFNNRTTPENLVYLPKSLNHEEIIRYLNQARCSLLPTRWDSQGLMTCETATYGIPTITSDIEICHEMLDSFSNVKYINNDDVENTDLSSILDELENEPNLEKNNSFFSDYTVAKELVLFEKVVSGNKDENKE